jgi:ABC-type Zn uptake system ZnuABC Zn-binding protein ZnuA
MSRTLLLALVCLALQAAEPLRVVATVPELGAIVRAVGGEDVAVTVLARPGDDPHRVEARPSFTVELARADLLVSTGFGLEECWLKPLRENSGNPRIRDDQGGHLQAQKAVRRPIGIDAIPKDEHGHGGGGADGHQHADGNPHCLLDPAVGLIFAGQLAERLSAFRPQSGPQFSARLAAFSSALTVALAGAEVAAKADGATLIDLDDRGALGTWLAQQGLAGKLGGWWGALAAHRGAALAADHDLYPYLARRFGLRIVLLIEPEPGVAPSARRLAELTGHLREDGVRAILTSPYANRRAIDLLAEKTGLKVAVLAHQAGALPGTDDYIAWIGADVQALAKALAP